MTWQVQYKQLLYISLEHQEFITPVNDEWNVIQFWVEGKRRFKRQDANSQSEVKASGGHSIKTL